jgi:hypothetical protein
MPITLNDLKTGPRKVRNKDGMEFFLSIVESYGAVGVMPFKIGAKRPARGKHWLLHAETREQWFSELEFAD